MQLDDPLDAIAVHAWNGTWGVIAVGFFAGQGLVTASYGVDPYTGNERQYGCFLGGDGKLLGAQIIYSLWLGGEQPELSLFRKRSSPIRFERAGMLGSFSIRDLNLNMFELQYQISGVLVRAMAV